MDKWNKIRKKYVRTELIGIISIILCLVVGLFCDWYVINFKAKIEIQDINDFSLTLLQVQSTIGTLVMSIIALITGNISDSYMGVSISDYYLNIRPWKLKQKVIILMALGLTVISVLFHVLEIYNTVFFLFIATLITIAISIIEIYSVFKGKNIANDEIEAYIDYVLESAFDCKTKNSIFQNFVLDWLKEINEQDKATYKKYLEVFKKCMHKLWMHKTDGGLGCIQQQCYKVSYCLLGSEKNLMKVRGVEFTQEVYNLLWSMILNEQPSEEQYKEGFWLFNDISSEILEAIYEQSIERVERVFRFEHFIDMVQRIEIWLGTKESDVGELCRFAGRMGYYLAEQKNRNHVLSQRQWEQPLSTWAIFSEYNIPSDKCEKFLWDKSKIYFVYCYSLLVNGMGDILKKGLYLQGIKNTYRLKNRYHALLYLMFHCYTYYLAERESEKYVSEKIKQNAQDIMLDHKVKAAYDHFLRLLSMNAEWLDLTMLQRMHEVLDKYEYFSEEFVVKEAIIDYVIDDFYIFTVLYISQKYYKPQLLKNNIDDINVYRYVQIENERKVKETFTTLYRLICASDANENKINTEVGLLYERLEKTIKQNIKEKHVKTAREEQHEYEEKVNERELCRKIEENVFELIKEECAVILTDDDSKNEIINVPLLHLNVYTNTVVEEGISGYYSYIVGRLLVGIANYLYKSNDVELKNRTRDFIDDKDFINYLNANSLKILLGSQYAVANRDYELAAEFKRFKEECETVFTDAVREGILLKENAIQVSLIDVNVSVNSSSISEEKVEYDNELDAYYYPIINGVPIEFTENELEEFLYNKRKIISVTAKISVNVKESPAGTIITG
ncbi:MAG: hypothetical protein IJZ53_13780 [Tyzzerella sp.]|nr:hypothetical protein [Tyzzerella sp.]